MKTVKSRDLSSKKATHYVIGILSAAAQLLQKSRMKTLAVGEWPLRSLKIIAIAAVL